MSVLVRVTALVAVLSAACAAPRPSVHEVRALYDEVQPGSSDWRVIEAAFPNRVTAEFIAFGHDRYACGIPLAEGGTARLTFELKDGVVTAKEGGVVTARQDSEGGTVRENWEER